MELKEFERRLSKLSKELGFHYLIGPRAYEEKIQLAEKRLHIQMPAQVRSFYEYMDGLHVSNPMLDILDVDRLSISRVGRLHFAVVGDRHNIYFDVSKYNVAKQWDILSEDDYLISHTMASFWSNKIWSWLKYGKEIWKDEDEC